MNSLVGLGAATSFTAGAAAMLVRRGHNSCGLTYLSRSDSSWSSVFRRCAPHRLLFSVVQCA